MAWFRVLDDLVGLRAHQMFLDRSLPSKYVHKSGYKMSVLGGGGQNWGHSQTLDFPPDKVCAAKGAWEWHDEQRRSFGLQNFNVRNRGFKMRNKQQGITQRPPPWQGKKKDRRGVCEKKDSRLSVGRAGMTPPLPPPTHRTPRTAPSSIGSTAHPISWLGAAEMVRTCADAPEKRRREMPLHKNH